MASNGTVISMAAFILFGAVIPISAQQNEPSAGGEPFQKVQSEFAEAYNRKDVAAMAAFFSENGVRITPSGIFRGLHVASCAVDVRDIGRTHGDVR